MNVVGRVRVDMKPVKQIMKRLGIDARGDVQRFHTANVKRRIQKYMPYRTGATHLTTTRPGTLAGIRAGQSDRPASSGPSPSRTLSPTDTGLSGQGITSRKLLTSRLPVLDTS